MNRRGRHRAADPAGDPVGDHRLVDGRDGVVRRLFRPAIIVFNEHGAMAAVAEAFHGPAVSCCTAGSRAYLARRWRCDQRLVSSTWKPRLAARSQRMEWLYQLLDNKYYFDRFNEIVFAGTARAVGQILWRLGDALMIDGLIVNGSARLVGWFSGVARQVQTGYLNHYAFAMISGLILLLGWAVLG